jgi:uracil-xanthine permease
MQMAALGMSWKLHGDGRAVMPGKVVAPDERLRWPRMFGLGAQHIIAMFSATTLVPLLTGFPVSTTLLFSGLGTIIFILITRNRVPSYTGSGFAFIAPVIAAKTDGGMASALGGIVAAGAVLFLLGLILNRVGYRVLESFLPPVVIGTIVAMVGLNLAPVAKDSFTKDAWIAFVTLAAVLLIGVVFRGFISRLSVFLGVAIGYIVAAIAGHVDFTPVDKAKWFGLPDFTLASFSMKSVLLIVPAAIIVLLVENAAHVKAVGSMSDRDLDPEIGRSIMGDGAATMVSGMFGGMGTVTYAENIGVMGLTKIYSTAAYLIAGCFAIALGLIPKFGAFISTIPVGVIGGVTTVLFGMIACMGLRMYVAGGVDFRDPVNLVTAAVGLIVGTADYTLTIGDYTFGGIALSAVGTIVVYQILRRAGEQYQAPEPAAHAESDRALGAMTGADAPVPVGM